MKGFYITFSISVLELHKNKLNLNEYLTLLKLSYNMDNEEFPFDPDPRYLERLIKDGYAKYDENGKLTLDILGYKIFRGNDLFEEFYKTFPHKVPVEGIGFRPVSTTDLNGTGAKITRTLWEKITKHKPDLQRKIIDNLKRELEHRKTTNTLGYLHNIDTWLRNATWEKWDDVPERKPTNYTRL